MPKEVIYSLTLDVKHPDIPFAVQKSISSQSGDLVKVFAHFQLQLVTLLRQMHEEELDEERAKYYDNDIPF